MTALGARIQTEREFRGMSIADLTRGAGLGRNSIGKIEAGKSNPRLSTITRIADVLGVNVQDLFLDGPDQLDLAFGIPAQLDLGPLCTLEARIRAALLELRPGLPVERLGLWPWVEAVDRRFTVLTSTSSAIRLRAPASLVPMLVGLTGAELRGLAPGVRLGAPVVRPVSPSGSLRVLVEAPTAQQAEVKVLTETTSAQCCPAIRIAGKRPLGVGSAWLAMVTGVPSRSSWLLQRPRSVGPEGIFVPA